MKLRAYIALALAASILCCLTCRADQHTVLAQSELDAIKSALTSTSLVQKSYSADNALGYEFLDGQLKGGPTGGHALMTFQLSEVRQQGDYLLLEGKQKLYVRVEGTKKLSPTQVEIPTWLTVYLPSLPSTQDLAQLIQGEMFYPDVLTAYEALTEEKKLCWTQEYSPTTKAILPSKPCPVAPTIDQIHLPQLTRQIDPQSPLGIRGNPGNWESVVSFTVNEHGTPADVHILRPSYLVPPNSKVKGLSQPVGEELDSNAVAAVRQYKFRPALKDGEPVPYHMFVEVQFQTFQ